jgi:hypothetical protein
MSNDANAMFIEMFDGVDLNVPVLPEQLPELKLHAPRVAGSANGLVRKLMYHDLLEKVLGEVPAPEPASLPTTVGAIPQERPETGTASTTQPKDSPRRAKLRQLLVDAGLVLSYYDEETVESLLDAMDAYISNSIKISRKVG